MSISFWFFEAKFALMESDEYKDKLVQAFGQRLKQLRHEKDLTQFDLAVKSGIDPRQIGRIENGAVSTSIATVGLLAKGLEMTLSELFDFEV